ncbi:MAG: FHA domain-containing protein [Fimbriimonadaceae bacterium]
MRLEFPGAGKRTTWLGDALPEQVPADAVVTEADRHEIKIRLESPKNRVFVLDEDRNALGSRLVSEVRGVWTVKPEDLDLIGRVTIRVVHDGKPLESASVTLTDSARTMNQILDSTAAGRAEFVGVRPGNLRVEVRYRSLGANAPPFRVSFDVPAERERAPVDLPVTVPEPAVTIDPPSPDAAAKTSATPDAGTASPPHRGGIPGGGLLAFVLVVAGIAAVAWLAVKAIKSNPDLVKQKLQDLGVEVPVPDEPAPADPVLPHAPPAPPEKIVLGDADPTPIASTASVPAAAAAVAGSGLPRLRGEDGSAFEIAEGTSIVGREEGTAVALVGHSSVSRRHAEIARSGDAVTVKDLGSTNGTFVNGVQIHDGVELKPGDTVQFGTVRFRFER